MSKLILGTAAFGKPYGIKGDPVPSEREIERIAGVAREGGIDTIHISMDYFPHDPEVRYWSQMLRIFKDFAKIKKDSDPAFFHFDNRPWGGCLAQVHSFCGISIYGMQDFVEGRTKHEPKIVQIPINLLDKRLMDYFYYWKQQNIEVHARSVFLQGLLLMDELPAWVNGQARGKIKLFHCVCRREGYEPYEAALGWVLGLDEIDRVIVGVNSARQLEQLLKVKPLKWDYDFSVTDETVLDPRKWPKA